MTIAPRAMITAFSAVCLALGLSACGEASSTGSYKGESKQVAQTITNLQSDATSVDASKVCSRDLAASVVKKLETDGSTCKKALESQLREIDTYSLTVESINPPKDGRTTAKVRSTWSGKEKVHELSFVKEGGRWKISGLS